MARILITLGILLVLAGLAWPFLKKLGLGHLPGDIILKKENMTFYFPIVTCIIISIVLSIVFYFIQRK